MKWRRIFRNKETIIKVRVRVIIIVSIFKERYCCTLKKMLVAGEIST